MNIFLVTCKMDGCLDCGSELYLIGAYTNVNNARAIAQEHRELSFEARDNGNHPYHLHRYWDVEITPISLDEMPDHKSIASF